MATGGKTAVITGAWGPGHTCASLVAAQLTARGWSVRPSGPHPSDHVSDVSLDTHLTGYVHGDLTDDAFASSLFVGLDPEHTVIVHLAPLVTVSAMAVAGLRPMVEALDEATRGTYVLYGAAVRAGVVRAVQASTLSAMDAYDDDLEVTEQWRPRPAPTVRDLVPHLCETTAIEFTRDPRLPNPMTITCLRFATLLETTIDGGDDAHPPVDPRAMWVTDAARAIVGAIDAQIEGNRTADRGHRWRLLHIASGAPHARFTSAIAHATIGYIPSFRINGS